MGRLATKLAAIVVNADNLPPKDQIPNVSIWDALLPRRYAGLSPTPKKKELTRKKKPVDSNAEMRVKDKLYEVKTDQNGKKYILAQKTSNLRPADGESKGEIEDVKKDVNAKEKDEKKNVDGGDNGGGGGDAEKKPNNIAFTVEEDKKLKKLKAEGKTWREIATEMHRPQGQLKTRFKETSNDDGGGEEDVGGKKDGNGKKCCCCCENHNNHDKNKNESKNDKKVAKSAVKEERPQKKDEHSTKASSKASSRVTRNGEALFTMKEFANLQEDELFSFGELQCILELLKRDDTQSWLRVASRFFDMTGRRVHPEDIKEKFAKFSKPRR